MEVSLHEKKTNGGRPDQQIGTDREVAESAWALRGDLLPVTSPPPRASNLAPPGHRIR